MSAISIERISNAVPASSPLSSTTREIESGFSSHQHDLVAHGRTDRRDDTFAHTCQRGFLAGTADQLFDIGTHRHARLGDQLDTVFRHGRHGRGVDDLRVDRHLHRLEHVAARQVDRRSHLEVELNIGLLRRNERMDDIGNVAARQEMRLQLVGIERKPCLRTLDHRRDDHRRRHLAPAHQNQLQQADSDARNQRREPQSHRNEVKYQPQRDEALQRPRSR